MIKTKRQILFIVLALSWMTIIFGFSANTGEESAGQSNQVSFLLGNLLYSDFDSWDILRQNEFAAKISGIVREAAHAAEYAILSLFVFLSIWTKDKNILMVDGLTVGICALYAISDEVHQSFVPGRSPQVLDVMIDCLGALIMAGILTLIIRLGSRRRDK